MIEPEGLGGQVTRGLNNESVQTIIEKLEASTGSCAQLRDGHRLTPIEAISIKGQIFGISPRLNQRGGDN